MDKNPKKAPTFLTWEDKDGQEHRLDPNAAFNLLDKMESEVERLQVENERLRKVNSKSLRINGHLTRALRAVYDRDVMKMAKEES